MPEKEFTGKNTYHLISVSTVEEYFQYKWFIYISESKIEWSITLRVNRNGKRVYEGYKFKKLINMLTNEITVTFDKSKMVAN